SFWDFVFCVSNVTLAVLFGLAIGNVMRGMPFAPDTPLSLPLFTDFGVRGKVGILDWYTVTVAAFTLVCLAAHGASYLALKTEGDIHLRSRNFSKWLWLSTFLLLLAVSVETFTVRPGMFAGMAARPLAWIALALPLVGLLGIFTGLRSHADQRVFLGGCA